MSINLPAIRQGIVTLLETIPSIQTVQAYERADVPTGQLPCASILLAKVTQPGYGDQGFGQLGAYDYEAEWHINVRLAPTQPQVEVVSQELFETIFAAVRTAFDPNQMIDPNGPGVVDVSSIQSGELLIPGDADKPFVAAFILTTRVVT